MRKLNPELTKKTAMNLESRGLNLFRASIIGLLSICVFPIVCIAANGERLDVELFSREIASTYRFSVPDDSKISEWQGVEFLFDLPKGKEAGLDFPARHLLLHAAPIPGNRGEFEVEMIQIGLGSHASWFRRVYGVRVTITPRRSPGIPPEIPLYGMASFVGKRSAEYLYSKEGKEAISDAIVKCFSRLQPEN